MQVAILLVFIVLSVAYIPSAQFIVKQGFFMFYCSVLIKPSHNHNEKHMYTDSLAVGVKLVQDIVQSRLTVLYVSFIMPN